MSKKVNTEVNKQNLSQCDVLQGHIPTEWLGGMKAALTKLGTKLPPR